ncbi:MAG: helix-turn-helix domain-containing protein [Actinomycetota bacterium]|nr:helix-turn-helix domain-containing protein [Actinomycetota bacterium]
MPEAAIALGISRSFAYELIARGEIESVRIGKARRVPVTSLREYVARLQQGEI